MSESNDNDVNLFCWKDEERKKNQLEEKRKKRELNEERKLMLCYRQNAKDLLLSEGLAIDINRCVMDIWQNRYFITAKMKQRNNGTTEFNVHDLIQNISRNISFPSTNALCGIYYLSNNFVLIDGSSSFSLFRLTQIDLVDSNLQLIQKIDRYRYMHLVIDSFNPSKILLVPNNGFKTVVIFKLVCDKIEVKSKVELVNADFFDVTSKAYFNDQLLMFKVNEWTRNLSNATITVQVLDAEKKSKTSKLEPLPSNVCSFGKYSDLFQCIWLGDHLFISIQFYSTSEYGIAFTNPQTCKWKIMEFVINLSIKRFLLVNNADLLIFAQERCSESNRYLIKNVYKLPMRKPELLRYKAWTKTVMLFKKNQAADPYEEARQYLPLNSDIRGTFAADQDDDE